jgi:NADH-quinone oxidoreductase subunit M
MRSLAFAIACLLGVLFAFPAWAVAPRAGGPAGQIVLSLPTGGRGPLELVPGQGGWVGELRVSNVGDQPLTVSRLAIRGDEDDVRSPPRLSVRFAEGAATSATIPPGASRDVLVSWVPERAHRVEQAFGHVIVTSSDEQAGEVAMGIRAQLPTGLGWIGEHALSLLLLLPLGIVLVAGVSRLAGRSGDGVVRRVAIGGTVSQVLLALWVYRHFVPDVGRGDGNDGYQLVERSVWVRSLGAEWYLGIDGTSVLLVLLVAAVALVAVVVAEESRRADAYYAAMALLASGLMGSLLGLDLALVLVSRAVVLLALVVLVGGWGGSRAHHAAAKMGIVGGVGLAATLVVFSALSSASARTYLVDGSAAAHTMAIPELARTSFAAKGSLLGLPFVDGAWLLLIVAVVAATPLVPLHGWLPDVLEEGPPGAAIVVGGASVALGPYMLVRVGLEALPEGARWAGASIAAFGGVSVAWGALCAVGQRDLRRFAGYAIVRNGGVCLFGIGSLTPQGLAGAVLALFAGGLAATMLLAVAALYERRARTCDVQRLQGLARETPVLACLLVAGLAASIGVPGMVGTWSLLLAFAGGVGKHPFIALLVAAALVVSAAAHARIARLLLFEKPDPSWKKSRHLEPFGGRLPDARTSELLALVPLAAVTVALGLWPVPALSPIESAARDASAAFEVPGPTP